MLKNKLKTNKARNIKKTFVLFQILHSINYIKTFGLCCAIINFSICIHAYIMYVFENKSINKTKS